MPANATIKPPQRLLGKKRVTPTSTGVPDPRPITEYGVEYKESGGQSQITIKLDQPCVIRSPAWLFVDCADGSKIKAATVTVSGNAQFSFKFAGIIPASVALVDVPYQDMQVQNFLGGFVRPGGQWFRTPS